ncbi:MAG: hypothetical protein ACKVOH_04340 [Chlamydiales bacterium]
MMNKRTIGVLFLLFIGSLSAYLFAKNQLKSPEEHYLYMLYARRGRIDANHDDPAKGRLTLLEVNSEATFFTEPPNRRGGKISLRDFLYLWSQGKDNYSDVPPNGFFIFYRDTNLGDYNDIPLTLSHPYYDQSEGVMSFDYVLLKEATIQSQEVDDLNLFILSTVKSAGKVTNLSRDFDIKESLEVEK